jgi:hypothetical protein
MKSKTDKPRYLNEGDEDEAGDGYGERMNKGNGANIYQTAEDVLLWRDILFLF